MKSAPPFAPRPAFKPVRLPALCRQMANGFDEAVLLLSGDCIRECNARAVELFAGQREQLLGQPLSDWIYDPPTGDKDPPLSLGTILSAVQAGTSRRLRLTLRRSDGVPFDVEIHLSRLRLGPMALVQAVLRPRLPALLPAPQREIDGEPSYRALVDGNINLIALWDLDGRCRLINPAGAATLGRALEECAGYMIEDLFPPTVAAPFREHLNAVNVTGRDLIVTGPMPTPAGERWFWTFFQPLRDAAGTITAVQTNAYDITERRAGETAARRRQQILEAVNFAAEQFLEPGDWQGHLPQVLQRLGRAANVSHVYLCENETGADGHVRFVPRFVWRADDARLSGEDTLADRLAETCAGYERWVERLARGDLVCGATPSFPDEERAGLEACGARTIAAIPLFAEAHWWGLIGIAEVREERHLSVAELDALRAAADLIGSAIVRARGERELRKANRALRTISACNEILVRAKEEHVLLQRVCRALVEIGGFRLAWVGCAADDDLRAIAPAAQFGLEDAPALHAPLLGPVADFAEAAAVAAALEAGRPHVVQEIPPGPAGNARRAAELERGYQSCIVLPLVTDGKRLGTLTIYSAKTQVFDELEVFLLEELANDLAYGLQALRTFAEREQAEEALRRSEERFRQLFERAGDAIFLVSHTGRIIHANRSACELLGYTREELLAIGVPDIIADYPEAERSDTARQISLHGYLFRERNFLRKDGSTVSTEVRLSALVWDDETVILGIVRDVTERLKAQEEKQTLEQQFFRAQKLESIGTLAGGIAHDFNNILAIILGYVSTLQLNPELPPSAQPGLAAMADAVDRGAGLVRQILTFARKSDVIYGPIDLNVMLKELQKMMRETFPRTIDVHFQGQKHLPLIMADATQIHQALLNVCVNARDAMPGGGKLQLQTDVVEAVHVRRQFRDAGQASYVRVRLSDSGMGMDDATRARIFEPFYTTKDKGKGTGLGLAVAYGAIRNHEGFIQVASTPGHGSVFEIYLPVPPSVPAARRAEPAVVETPVAGSGTILIIEDETVLAALLAAQFEQNGYRVLVARDGVEGIALFELYMREVDLVLTDLGLPRLSGGDAIRWMKKHRPELKVVATTGYLEPELRTELEDIGVSDIIQKPCTPPEYLRRIAAAMRG